MTFTENYWQDRYQKGHTQWDMGQVSPPIKAYFDQVKDRDLRILIPGAGNSYEAEYLYRQGFSNVHILDIAKAPLDNFARRVPDFPKDQILHADFFEHQSPYDIIVEQTFFCALPPSPEMRQRYARQMAALLPSGGRLVGLWFSFPLRENQEEPPFGGSKTEYLQYFEPLFDIRYFEECYNSIPPRQGNEYFGLMIRKEP